MQQEELSAIYFLAYDNAEQLLRVCRGHSASVSTKHSVLTIYGSGLSVTSKVITKHVTWLDLIEERW